MKFKPYPKVLALHKEECTGILNGTCYIQEKVDGANASIWLGDDGEIRCGSRTQDVTNQGFRGLVDWARSHEGIKKLLSINPNLRLYGEWCVRHSIAYDNLSYQKFYLFEAESDDKKIDIEEMYIIAKEYDIPTVHLFAKIENPTLEQIQEFAGKSVLGSVGEGVVIKNFDFINAFGDHINAKYVTQEFREKNAIVFGGNNRHSETYTETHFMNEFVTVPRVQKCIHKMESMNDEKPDMKHLPQIMGMVYHDIIKEEAWEISKKCTSSNTKFDFKAFQRLCYAKAKQIYIEIITNDISVAHMSRTKEILNELE